MKATNEAIEMISESFPSPVKTFKKESSVGTDEQTRRRSIRSLKKQRMDNILLAFTVASVILGLVAGCILKLFEPSQSYIEVIAFPGELFMNMLKMLIIPLIISCLITGLSSLDSKASTKMGLVAVGYYTITTALAVLLGIVIVTIIRPGVGMDKSMKTNMSVVDHSEPTSTADAFMDLLRNIFPENIVQACLQQTKSYRKTVNNATTTRQKFTNTTNVLGLVTFSVAFGITLSQSGKKAELMVNFFIILNDVVMQLVRVIMWYSPIGIFSLIIGKILSIDNIMATAAALGMYMITIVIGLIVHSCITLVLMFYVVTKRNPFEYFKGLFQAFVTALGTSSSAATLPVTFRCLEEKCRIDPRVTRLVLPIGATINMDGTALYEAVASIFIAQLNNYSLGFAHVFTISITATLAAIGAASVPSAGLVTMVLVLNSVGLPTKDISLIVTVDWMLDRLRTSVNVLGDAFGAGIVDYLCKGDLAQSCPPPHILDDGDDDDDDDDNDDEGNGDDNKNNVVEIEECCSRKLFKREGDP